MVNRKELNNYCQDYLNVTAFEDYCPNGLQVEGVENINKIVSGVSANLALIERAIDEKADAIFVHHGIFWKNEGKPLQVLSAERFPYCCLIILIFLATIFH